MNEVEVICKHWLSFKQLPAFELNEKTAISAVSKALKHYTVDEILDAISFYAAEVSYLSYSTYRNKPIKIRTFLSPTILKQYMKDGASRDKCNDYSLVLNNNINNTDSTLAIFVINTEQGKARVVIHQPQSTLHSHEINVKGLDESIVIEEVCYAEYDCLLVEVNFFEGNRKTYYSPIAIYNNDSKTNLNECLLAIKGGKDSFESYCKKYHNGVIHGDILNRTYRAYIKE